MGGRLGATSTGWGADALPPGAAAVGPTLPERRQEGGTTLGALPTRGGTGPTVRALPVGAAGSMGGHRTGELPQDGEPKSGGRTLRLFPTSKEGPAKGREGPGAEWMGPAPLLTDRVDRRCEL